MIPVALQPPPASFDERVRRPGLRWLEEHGIALDRPVESGTTLHPYWRECLGELHESYRGICAYLCVFIERCTGGVSTDHFIAKSKNAGLAYEWSNYRLACSTMNARKRDFEDVLDPFSLPPDTFRLALATGHVYPNPTLSKSGITAAQETISRLGLDDVGCQELRARRFLEYVRARGAMPNPDAEAHLRGCECFPRGAKRRQRTRSQGARPKAYRAYFERRATRRAGSGAVFGVVWETFTASQAVFAVRLAGGESPGGALM